MYHHAYLKQLELNIAGVVVTNSIRPLLQKVGLHNTTFTMHGQNGHPDFARNARQIGGPLITRQLPEPGENLPRHVGRDVPFLQSDHQLIDQSSLRRHGLCANFVQE